MGLENPGVVDAISTAKDDSQVTLSIFDAWDWVDEANHLFAIQDKLNSYSDFVQSGQIYENYPAAVSRPVIIQLVTKYPLPAKAEAYLNVARKAAVQLNLQISSRILEP